jgi:hypothetical protein
LIFVLPSFEFPTDLTRMVSTFTFITVGEATDDRPARTYTPEANTAGLASPSNPRLTAIFSRLRLVRARSVPLILVFVGSGTEGGKNKAFCDGWWALEVQLEHCCTRFLLSPGLPSVEFTGRLGLTSSTHTELLKVWPVLVDLVDMMTKYLLKGS